MIRIVLAVIAGFVCWVIAWIGSEKILSAVWPEGFGAHQRAFQAAIENGGQFSANTSLLVTHIVLGSIISVMSGFLAALVAGDNTLAPLALGVLLLAFGVLKATLSWRYAPIWYHGVFSALLLPLAMAGARLYSTA